MKIDLPVAIATEELKPGPREDSFGPAGDVHRSGRCRLLHSHLQFPGRCYISHIKNSNYANYIIRVTIFRNV